MSSAAFIRSCYISEENTTDLGVILNYVLFVYLFYCCVFGQGCPVGRSNNSDLNRRIMVQFWQGRFFYIEISQV